MQISESRFIIGTGGVNYEFRNNGTGSVNCDMYFCMMFEQLIEKVAVGDFRELARAISLIENAENVPAGNATSGNSMIVGLTGPPGGGKSTLTDALIKSFLDNGSQKIAVICVDPSSPFTNGAVLGDRIRMNRWYNDPRIFIRSLASRGELGGLSPRIPEITNLLRSVGFDLIIIETVGVGQTEVQISRLADVTVVVLVPEAGDVIQTMKAGLMEIADIFVVNKSDRPGAENFYHDIKMLAHVKNIPVVKTIAIQHEGVDELRKVIRSLGH